MQRRDMREKGKQNVHQMAPKGSDKPMSCGAQGLKSFQSSNWHLHLIVRLPMQFKYILQIMLWHKLLVYSAPTRHSIRACVHPSGC
jgi:hypothetical protein